MKDSNNPIRILAIASYNLNPNYCKNCGNKIEVREKESPKDTKKKKFCNKSCACTFNNKGVCRVERTIKTFCSCGKSKERNSKTCLKCYHQTITVTDKPLSYFLKDGKYSTTKLTHLRKSAKITLENSGKEKICLFCNDKELIPILEVCHIKGIMEFDKSTTLRMVNDINNLEWMCPNHHVLYDRKLITLVNGSA